VSIPASFRRVIEAGDPDWSGGELPKFIVVYGDERRNYLEGFPIEVMDEVDEKIARHPRGSAKREELEELYSTQTVEVIVDDTGRIVLPIKLRDKIGLDGMAVFAATGDTFQIWSPEAYKARRTKRRASGLDPAVDPSVYLDDYM
jgi:MraZ protein